MSYQTVGVSGLTSSNKIPEYAREYKREYQFIRGLKLYIEDKIICDGLLELESLINKIEN